MKKNLTKHLLLLLMLSYSCSKKHYPKNEIGIDVRDFGAVPNDGKDDSASFLRAIQFGLKSNQKKIFIPSGIFDIHSRVDVTNFNKDINIIGSKNTIVNCPEQGVFFFKPQSVFKKLKNTEMRNSSKISLSDISNVELGDIIRLYSDSIWETGWGYKENDTHIISAVNGDDIVLKHKLIFNYKPTFENVYLEISKPVHISFENIKFLINPSQNWQKTSVITSTGTYFSAKNISIRDNQPNIFHRGFSLANCPQVNFENLIMENLEYGILMNYCRDIKINGIVAKGLRHAIAPANACINMYATDIIGERCQGVIDAHQSFNIHYNNVKDKNATQFSNCRALGTKITNSVFSVDTAFYQDYCYWSNQLLTEEYKFLYKEYDTEFDHVEWIHNKPSGFNGLTSFSCRDFIVKNCKSHNISVYGELFGKAIVSNCELGSIRINSTAVNIDSTIMDGNLCKNAPYVFRFSGAGKANLNNIKVVNYNDNVTDMFEYFYNTSNNNSISIKNSSFCKLKNWSEKLIYPNLDYTTLFIENSNFDGFIQKLPSTLFNSKTLKQNMKNVSGIKLNKETIE